MKSYYILIIIAVLIVAGFLAVSGLKLPSLGPIPTPLPSATPDVSELIKVEEPISEELVTSPLMIKGEARGYWFFEASFPVKIYDANGIELGMAVAQAEGEWMTEEFVKFNAILKFEKPSTETGMLVFKKDNPSDLPENDAELKIPVRFDLANWPSESPSPTSEPISGQCKIGGCSNQLCLEASDEEDVTTCEYKEEYACYLTAKCEKQSDGKCGWTPTEELVACLYSAWGAPAE